MEHTHALLTVYCDHWPHSTSWLLSSKPNSTQASRRILVLYDFRVFTVLWNNRV